MMRDVDQPTIELNHRCIRVVKSSGRRRSTWNAICYARDAKVAVNLEYR